MLNLAVDNLAVNSLVVNSLAVNGPIPLYVVSKSVSHTLYSVRKCLPDSLSVLSEVPLGRASVICGWIKGVPCRAHIWETWHRRAAARFAAQSADYAAGMNALSAAEEAERELEEALAKLTKAAKRNQAKLEKEKQTKEEQRQDRLDKLKAMWAEYCSKYPAKPEWEDTPKEDLTEYELKSQGSER